MDFKLHLGGKGMTNSSGTNLSSQQRSNVKDEGYTYNCGPI
ncbi:hypothetical protein [Xenorhabdus santafensis]|nr:hypothetical protein [Xenorhabdus sp. 12]